LGKNGNSQNIENLDRTTKLHAQYINYCSSPNILPATLE